MADRRRPVRASRSDKHACQRQGLGQEFRPLADLRLDPETGQWENLGSFSDPSNGKRLGVYGIPADRNNNLYLLDLSSNIGRIDAKTGQFTVYRGEIANSRPRRGAVDDQNRLWFAEYAGNAVGMFDPKTEQIKEWVLPTPWGQEPISGASQPSSTWRSISRPPSRSGGHWGYPNFVQIC